MKCTFILIEVIEIFIERLFCNVLHIDRYKIILIERLRSHRFRKTIPYEWTS